MKNKDFKKKLGKPNCYLPECHCDCCIHNPAPEEKEHCSGCGIEIEKSYYCDYPLLVPKLSSK